MPSIVQFFHPGIEHGYDNKKSSQIKDWNKISISHKRKFLLNEGSYIKNGKKYNCNLLFWGEWEPPSRVEEIKHQTICPPYGINPRYIHTPFLPNASQVELYQEKCKYQNTDPFVFGEKFIYSICGQKRKKLRKLEKGSFIICGSRVNFRFVIDTYFVVKEVKPYFSIDDIKKMKLGIYKDIVIDFTLDRNRELDILPNGRTLYKGATIDDPEHGMFSFVPAKVCDSKKTGFPRFYMPDDFYKTKNRCINSYFSSSERRNGKIYEGMNRGYKYEDVDIEEICKFWGYIKNEVSKDHVLGCDFTMPKVDKNFKFVGEKNTPPSSAKRKSCISQTSCL